MYRCRSLQVFVSTMYIVSKYNYTLSNRPTLNKHARPLISDSPRPPPYSGCAPPPYTTPSGSAPGSGGIYRPEISLTPCVFLAVGALKGGIQSMKYRKALLNSILGVGLEARDTTPLHPGGMGLPHHYYTNHLKIRVIMFYSIV